MSGSQALGKSVSSRLLYFFEYFSRDLTISIAIKKFDDETRTYSRV